jgi:hypothetical protein
LSKHSQQEEEEMRSKMLVILTIVSVLALSLSACGEEDVITATPEPVGPVTFNQMVTEAMAEVPVISPEEAHRRMEEDPRTLVIDPRDAAEIPLSRDPSHHGYHSRGDEHILWLFDLYGG